MISIIIPNYNHASFLNERIESVLNQSYDDFELIILDDCSTDESVSILESYRGHPKISHIELNSENSGSTFKQWKKGLELAEGEWIWIAESDDIADNDFLKILTECTDHHKTGLVFSNSIIIDENNIRLSTGVEKATWLSEEINKHRFEKSFVSSGKTFFAEFLIYSNVIYNASAVLFKKAEMLKYIDKALDFKLYGDWFLWTHLLAEHDVAYITKPLNYFRMHSKSVRHQSGHNLISRIEEQTIFTSRMNELIEALSFTEKEKNELKKINNKQGNIRFIEMATRYLHQSEPWNFFKYILRTKPFVLLNKNVCKNLLQRIIYHK